MALHEPRSVRPPGRVLLGYAARMDGASRRITRACLRLLAIVTLAVAPLATVPCPAQCSTQWLPGEGFEGIPGNVASLTAWDPDGPGPAPMRLAAGGVFAFAGATVAANVAWCDPATGDWQPLGDGLSGHSPSGYGVTSLAVLPNGDLVAGGHFTHAGTSPAMRVARWDGTQWHTLGTGLSSFPRALAVLPNGDLIAAGTFTSAGGAPCPGIARWDGQTWTALPGLFAGVFEDLAVAPNGDLVAAGSLQLSTGGTLRIARFDGTSWSGLGSGLGNTAFAVTTLPNGDIVASGPISSAGGVTVAHIARWDGVAWHAMGTGLPAPASQLRAAANGELIAVGSFSSVAGQSVSGLARWNPTTGWSAVGGAVQQTPNGPTRCVVSLPSGELVVGGQFVEFAGQSAWGVALYDGTQWSRLPASLDGVVYAMTTLSNGDLVVGGTFDRVRGVESRGLARWNGQSWSGYGEGIRGASVETLASTSDGGFLVGGAFTHVDGLPAGNIARWADSDWSTMAAGFDGTVHAVLELADRSILAGGAFSLSGSTSTGSVARWDGAAWTGLGTVTDTVLALAQRPNGIIIAGMHGLSSTQTVARWSGQNWQPLLGMQGLVRALHVAQDGTLYAGGSFGNASNPNQPRNIARWDHATSVWMPLGSGLDADVRALVGMPNGDLVAAGSFSTAGGVPARGLARWRDQSWSAVSSHSLPPVYSAATTSGSLFAGGYFTISSPVFTRNLAQFETTCPANVTTLAPGCSGSGSANTLTATRMAWVGGRYRATAAGLPMPSVALDVFGLSTTSTPLSGVLPQGAPGCVLAVSPDLLTVLPVANGTAEASLLLPNLPALAGVPLYHQVVTLALDAQLQIAEVTSTNALTLTIGIL